MSVHAVEPSESTAAAQERAYKEAVKLPTQTVTQYLLDNVGQRLTTVAVGLSDARPVRKWAQGCDIREENEARLRLLYRVARSIELTYDQETARAFLRSSSPVIGDRSPVHAIADLDEAGALDAVRFLVEP